MTYPIMHLSIPGGDSPCTHTAMPPALCHTCPAFNINFGSLDPIPSPPPRRNPHAAHAPCCRTTRGRDAPALLFLSFAVAALSRYQCRQHCPPLLPRAWPLAPRPPASQQRRAAASNERPDATRYTAAPPPTRDASIPLPHPRQMDVHPRPFAPKFFTLCHSLFSRHARRYIARGSTTDPHKAPLLVPGLTTWIHAHLLCNRCWVAARQRAEQLRRGGCRRRGWHHWVPACRESVAARGQGLGAWGIGRQCKDREGELAWGLGTYAIVAQNSKQGAHPKEVWTPGMGRVGASGAGGATGLTRRLRQPAPACVRHLQR